MVHESNLPEGRVWSPLTGQVLEGCDSIPVTLFEASEGVDSGAIYLQEQIKLNSDELVDELRYLQAQMTFNLCREFINNFPSILEMVNITSCELIKIKREINDRLQIENI